MTKTIAIACDHGGYALKEELKKRFDSYDWLDLGVNAPDSVDYPDYAHKLADVLKAGKAQRGVLVCGTGIGISIAANRHPHIRSAVCTNTTMARLCREHNDANVLALGERVTGVEVAADCLSVFLNTDFEGGRHARRVDKMTPELSS